MSKAATSKQRFCYTVIETAAKLQVTQAQVVALIESGELLAINIGKGSRNAWRIPINAADGFSKRRRSSGGKAKAR